MIRFIAEYKDHRVPGRGGRAGLRWGVEPMCTVLAEHGITISPSTYYEQVAKQPTRAQLRDQQVAELIRAEREHPGYGRFASTLGSRKMWIRLRGQGHDVARCTIERLMGANGWQGASYRSRHKTTVRDQRHHRSADLVKRNFAAPAPNRLWVTDFTYVPTWTGMAYVAFVIDAYARRIIGWRAARRIARDRTESSELPGSRDQLEQVDARAAVRQGVAVAPVLERGLRVDLDPEDRMVACSRWVVPR